LRHAKSEWSKPDLSDFDRPLNGRGNADAPAMARLLRDRKVTVDLIISSPAVRTMATCKIIAAAIGYPEKNIFTDKRIYLAEEDTLLKQLKKLRNEIRVMLVGHNPGLTSFANSILGTMIDHIPTCGIVTCELNIENWDDIHWGCGKQSGYDVPQHG
jgi:phosphohistidine phosphatase